MYNITRTANDLKVVEALIKDKTFEEARQTLNEVLEIDEQGKFFIITRENYQALVVEEEDGSYSVDEEVLIKDDEDNVIEKISMSYGNIMRFIKFSYKA